MPFVPSVTFTLGSVMGRLFDAPLPEKVEFRCSGDETTVGFRHSLDAYFYRKNGVFFLCNVCDNDNSYLALSVARNGELQPKTILIPGNCEYNVTGFFADCAKRNVDALMLTSSILQQYKTIPDLNDMYITIAASARNIIINGAFRQISDFISVCAGKNFVAVSTAGRPLVKVVFLAVEGHITATVENIPGNDGTAPFIIPLPNEFRSESMLDLSITCQIGGFANLA